MSAKPVTSNAAQKPSPASATAVVVAPPKGFGLSNFDHSAYVMTAVRTNCFRYIVQEHAAVRLIMEYFDGSEFADPLSIIYAKQNIPVRLTIEYIGSDPDRSIVSFYMSRHIFPLTKENLRPGEERLGDVETLINEARDPKNPLVMLPWQSTHDGTLPFTTLIMQYADTTGKVRDMLIDNVHKLWSSMVSCEHRLARRNATELTPKLGTLKQAVEYLKVMLSEFQPALEADTTTQMCRQSSLDLSVQDVKMPLREIAHILILIENFASKDLKQAWLGLTANHVSNHYMGTPLDLLARTERGYAITPEFGLSVFGGEVRELLTLFNRPESMLKALGQFAVRSLLTIAGGFDVYRRAKSEGPNGRDVVLFQSILKQEVELRKARETENEIIVNATAKRDAVIEKHAKIVSELEGTIREALDTAIIEADKKFQKVFDAGTRSKAVIDEEYREAQEEENERIKKLDAVEWKPVAPFSNALNDLRFKELATDVAAIHQRIVEPVSAAENAKVEAARKTGDASVLKTAEEEALIEIRRANTLATKALGELFKSQTRNKSTAEREAESAANRASAEYESRMEAHRMARIERLAAIEGKRTEIAKKVAAEKEAALKVRRQEIDDATEIMNAKLKGQVEPAKKTQADEVAAANGAFETWKASHSTGGEIVDHLPTLLLLPSDYRTKDMILAKEGPGSWRDLIAQTTLGGAVLDLVSPEQQRAFVALFGNRVFAVPTIDGTRYAIAVPAYYTLPLHMDVRGHAVDDKEKAAFAYAQTFIHSTPNVGDPLLKTAMVGFNTVLYASVEECLGRLNQVLDKALLHDITSFMGSGSEELKEWVDAYKKDHQGDEPLFQAKTNFLIKHYTDKIVREEITNVRVLDTIARALGYKASYTYTGKTHDKKVDNLLNRFITEQSNQIAIDHKKVLATWTEEYKKEHKGNAPTLEEGYKKFGFQEDLERALVKYKSENNGEDASLAQKLLFLSREYATVQANEALLKIAVDKFGGQKELETWIEAYKKENNGDLPTKDDKLNFLCKNYVARVTAEIEADKTEPVGYAAEKAKAMNRVKENVTPLKKRLDMVQGFRDVLAPVIIAGAKEFLPHTSHFHGPFTKTFLGGITRIVEKSLGKMFALVKERGGVRAMKAVATSVATLSEGLSTITKEFDTLK